VGFGRSSSYSIENEFPISFRSNQNDALEVKICMKPAKYIEPSNILLPILTERLKIRKLTREDFNNIYGLCLQSKTNDWPSGWNMSEEEASDFLDWQLDKYERFDVINDMVPFAIERLEDSTFIGHCHIGSIAELKETEIAYGIAKQFRGKGYATEVVAGLTDWAIDTFNLPYVVATIAEDNIASLKVIEKSQFLYYGMRELKNYSDEKVLFKYFRFYKDSFKALHKELYSLKDKSVHMYQIPQMKYLVASGVNDRDIYQMYDYNEIWLMGRFINRVKYYTKNELQKNFSRMPLELEWGDIAENGVEFKAFIRIPHYINEELFDVTMNDLKKRHKIDEVDLSIKEIPQRLCAQLLHQGDYASIKQSKQLLIKELINSGYQLQGEPQEIFINHPYCNPPEKLNILLRQQVINI